MSPVVERSPQLSRDRSSSHLGNEIVNESSDLDGTTNISGTTVIDRHHAVSDDSAEDDQTEDSDDDNPIFLLVSKHSDSSNIVELAMEWKTNPKSQNAKVLKRRRQKLIDSMKHYGPDMFIDVARIQKLIPSVPSTPTSASWQPTPTLHFANCARLAAEVLLTDSSPESFRNLIGTLNSRFPAPFLNDVYAGSVAGANGVSEKAVFRLALEIRTQWFISELERESQGGAKVDALLLLKKTFFFEQGYESLDARWLRAFGLPEVFENEDQSLPARFQDEVIERFRDLKLEIAHSDLSGLRASYKWHRFAMRVAEFLHGRDHEIRWQFRNQAQFSTIQEKLEQLIESKGVNPEPRGDHAHSHEERSSARIHDVRFEVRDPVLPSGPPGPSNSPRKIIKPKKKSKAQRLKEGRNFGNWQDMDKLSYTGRELNLTKTAHGNEALPRSTQQSNGPAGAATYVENSHLDEIPESLEHGFDDGETTFINNDEDLRLGEPVEQSTTPPGSARTRQMSYNPDARSEPYHRRQQTAPTSSANFVSTPQGQRRNHNVTPRRTLLDHQTGASRVSDIDENETQSSNPSTEPKRRVTKRPREPESDQSDDDFEQDSREINIALKRAEKPQKVRRIERSATPDSATGLQLQQTLAESSQPAVLNSHVEVQIPRAEREGAPITLLEKPGQVQRNGTPPPPAPSQAPSATQTSLQTIPAQSSWAKRHITPSDSTPSASKNASTRPQPVTPARKGGRWTAVEDERFIRLMRSYPMQWAKILEQDLLVPDAEGGPLFSLRGRTQVNLKDHARDLKAKFMLAGDPIPPGFENVQPAKRVGLLQ
ncbi:MYB DNA-binding domain protein [Penicillium chermesinum]|nr:MYB DNA-binding domain protein [Penicillium chermesinum]